MFTPLFSKKSVIEECDRELLMEIAGKRKHCSQHSLYCKEVGGKWGIWAELGSTHIVIPPVDLLGTIYSGYERLYVYNIDDADQKKTRVYIDVTKEPFIYRWALVSPFSEIYMEMYYMQDDYITGVKQVITELYAKMLEDAPLAYDDFDVKIEAVKMCVDQLDVQAALPSFYMLRTKDIQKEEFVFAPHGTEGYTIGVGGRWYYTFLTLWDNSYERIRHQLEEFAYSRKATLELSFDGSETILKLEEVPIVDQIDEHDSGVGYRYKDYIRVEIRSNNYAGQPTIVGYCDVRETLTTLYTGLLQMALIHPEEPIPYVSDTGRLVAYNMFKSPIIERVLDTERKRDYSTYELRQVKVKDVLTIDPDYDVFIRHLDGSMGSCYELDELCGQHVQFEGLEEWCSEMKPVIIEAAVGKTHPMDWEDFHRRGLEYAKQLRKVLPLEYDLWYEAPFEDKSGTIRKPILII